MMRHELWSAVLGACTDIDRRVATATGDLPDRTPVTAVPSTSPSSSSSSSSPPISSKPPRTGIPHLETAWRDPKPAAQRAAAERAGPKDPPRRAVNDPPDQRDLQGLVALREEIVTRLATLWQQIEREEGHDRVRTTLTIYIDERVMGLLPEYLRWSWPLLQKDLTGSTTGGAEFFRFIDHALHDPRTPQLVLEVYYFCLNHGFVGMHANDLVRLDEHKGWLKTRMALPAIALPSRSDADPELDVLPTRWATWSYYVLALIFVVAVTALLTMLSNYGDGRGYG